MELYAPGEAVVSGKLGGGSIALDGTSMAAPHVTGAVSLYKQAHPAATPEELFEWLDEEATTDTLHKLSKSSPDQVLFTGGL
ncbi:S8 family serine peptidase [Streptomyces sp. Isolate_45]|uniref:S8 family serine peptidase n=1 Tax=Streptomyces sp. Isolate_45 TaxID=2950111 RepID=UPI002481ADEA|nr:S8 family serine peptidase [Streptomyces sp. Isolate_45]MDA5284308.1 S8 family serine peptidase [Streptomyces sp. Isolate_45]